MNAFWNATLAETVTRSEHIVRGALPTLDAGRWLASYSDAAPTSSNQGVGEVAFQRWYRFKEAFSPKFVTDTLASLPYRAQHCVDPFGGSGTTAITCRMLGLSSSTVEVNPFLADLIEAKLTPTSPTAFLRAYEGIVRNLEVEAADMAPIPGAPLTLTAPGVNDRYVFSEDAYGAARAILRRAASASVEHRRLLRVLLGSVLIPNSNVVLNGKGRRYRSGWQSRPKSGADIVAALDKAVDRAADDLSNYASLSPTSHRVLRGDARRMLRSVESADVAIMSPPYPNSFDYTDVYNIELWMLGYLRGAEDGRLLRQRTLRSHVQTKWTGPRSLGTSAALDDVVAELQARRADLWNRNIPEMVGYYFDDLAKVFRELHRILPPGRHAVVAIGDSQYAGVKIDVGEILTERLGRAGFHLAQKGAIRSMRNSSQHGGGVRARGALPRLRTPLRGRMPMKPRSLIPLPTIERVALSNFDLYTRRPDVDVAVAKPVFCLIGANGLGKSTFLNTLNYAITGALPEPARRFQSAVDYFKNASRPDRREDYFRGRLSTAAAASATATVTLAFERMSVTVERAIGGGGEVVSLRTRAASLDDDQAAQAADMEELAEDLEGRYREIILRETGLKDFAQFVFVFHFLLTFDEGRHLLMWDDGALTNALYLAFGADPQQARGAETIRREMEREDSRARNARFAARNVTKRIEQLGDVLRRPEGVSTTTDEELRLEHERLLRDAEEATDRARRKRIEMQAAEAKRGSVSAALLEAQIQYRRQFAERLRGGSAIEHNPIVSGSINDDVCTICGTRHIAERLREKVASGDCPLCDSPVTRGRQDGDDETFESLRLLDVEIGALHDRLESLMLDHRTVSDQLASSERTEEAARARLSEFEEAKAPDLTALRASTGLAVLSDELARLEAEKQGFIEQSRGALRRAGRTA